MPLPLLKQILTEGVPSIPWVYPILRTLPWIALIAGLKWYFSGARNPSERLLRSKVIILTGGTSGIGASLAHSLASRGAQLILLTAQPPTDPFLAEYIDDLRSSTSNPLIWAEQCDLSSLHSIRKFATKWIDNAPPRRLDMLILCAATLTPRWTADKKSLITADGLEPCWGVNYLANFHLLSILSPAIRAQPPDRDVRVLVATCQAYRAGEMKSMRDDKAPLPKGREYGTSKMALMCFARSFQRHLDSYKRPDKAANNARVVLVDPGVCRTPGTRRWMTGGSVLGLLVYLVLWPLWWLVLKGPEGGAEGFLYAAMEANFGKGEGGKFVRDCREMNILRSEVDDEKAQAELWKFSEKQIEALEKEGAVKRALQKKEMEAAEKKERTTGRVEEIVDEKEKNGAVNGSTATQRGQKTPGSRKSKKTR